MADILKQGSRGDAVKQLQTALKQRGYDVGDIDGIYGPKTANAVRAFQKDNKLSVDGIAGPQTLGALNKATSPSTSNQTPNNQTSKPTPQKDYTDTLNTLYNALLGRDVDPSGLTYWSNKLSQGESIDNIMKSIMASDEYKEKQQAPKKPELPKLPEVPDVREFKPDIDREQLYEDALNLLKPQYERTLEQLQELYDINRQAINDDALKRGLARSSYVGSRLDAESERHGERIADAQRSLQEQANQLAAQQYDAEWNRQYQLYRDSIADDWARYNAASQNAWNEYNALYNVWRDYVGDQRYNQQFNFNREQFDWEKEQAEKDRQFRQEQFDWQKYMDQEQLALQKQAATRRASSGSSSANTTNNNPPGADISKSFTQGNPIEQAKYYNRAWEYLQNLAREKGPRYALNYFLQSDVYRNNLGPFWNRIYQDLDTMAREYDAYQNYIPTNEELIEMYR